ncbi:TraG family conjugative transposon ATPase [Paraflavitalea sp. CAU 1676]|uniref:TraG family conjugative transposon ATPase n=1 Tax=Paraflavitalea sp. CAU 1676 TaxID=3032598 RepID=UPI0023DAB7A0|nr:TraG family conjugative transposon ATPase [Paraflavitalea sp. CAU 1676]MDF2190511.1 TraG family conjugative transposon ATPase [Paraflavitalea sp. CAU 1676]
MKRVKRFEECLPILKVENDCLLSKKGDITISFELVLPEIFTLSSVEYESLHQTWVKAIRVLPTHSILQKQDWYLKGNYQADFSEEKTFLSHSSEKYFNERPYLNHKCYIYLTKKPLLSRPPTALNSILLRNSMVPSQSLDAREISAFLDKTGQFAKILEDSGFIKVRQLSGDELVGSNQVPGLLEKYCFLLNENDPPAIKDIQINEDLRIGDFYLQCFSMADVENLPPQCDSKTYYEKYSTDQTRFPISFAAPLGQLLSCNHIYNQYIIIEDPQVTLKKLENKRLRLQSLSLYSRQNSIGTEAISDFLNESISQQRIPIKAHFNVFAWTDNKDDIKEIRNSISAALAKLDARAKQETVIAPQLFFAGIPGAASELPLHDTFDTFAEQAVCFFIQETNYRTSLSPVGMRLGDRLTGYPLMVDISDEYILKGISNNRNKFILAPSGGGKSFFCCHYLRSYLETGAHCVVVDVGHSYKGLCDIVNGYYFTYSEDNPIRFNPFFIDEEGLDTEKKESIKALLVALWKKEDESYTRSEYVSLSNAIQNYYFLLQTRVDIFPCFDSFYEFLRDDFSKVLSNEGVKDRQFDIDNFLYVLKPFYKGGEYDYLLNAKENLDLLNTRFIVFELDAIKDHPILLPIVMIITMSVFINKMRKLKGIRKIILVEEAWKAIARDASAEYIRYLSKTVRKHFGELVMVSQEVEDIISSTIIKDAIINNSDIKILLDQSKYLNKFDRIQELLGLTDKDKTLILSMNKANDSSKKYKDVFISIGGIISKVYRTEVSLQEYLAYTTEEKEKLQVQLYARKYGSIQKGIAALANEIQLKLAA